MLLSRLIVLCLSCGACAFGGQTVPKIEIWHGDPQRVGHLGEAQPDFNVLGRVTPPGAFERLFWSVNGRGGSPMQFHAFRRLVEEGDFNADIPIAWLHPGSNTVTLTATLKDGEEITSSLVVNRETGHSTLPFEIDWRTLSDPQSVGQYVDGKWRLAGNGLRPERIGYDRLFLIGDPTWQDYEILTSVTIHAVAEKTSPLSGGAGLGWIWRFAGHAVGGPRNFPAAQPKWGYQPFGGIGWLRWPSVEPGAPYLQFYPGVGDQVTNFGRFPYALEETYAVRLQCRTLPETPDGAGVTRYSFKIWKAAHTEPAEWVWSHRQEDAHALRRGGCALVAHHVDATFGDMLVLAVD